MGNILSQMQTSNPLISELPSQKTSIKQTIVEMVKAMQADFGRAFQNQFHDPVVLSDYKNRLLTKLRGYPSEVIIAGYERCVDRNPRFCPTVPEIEASAKEVLKNIEQDERNKSEAQQLVSLPAPTFSCDPIALLSEAKKERTSEELTKEEKAIKHDERMKNHAALLVLSSHHIKQLYADENNLCKFPSCSKAGSISNGTHGGDNFYCVEHWRMS